MLRKQSSTTKNTEITEAPFSCNSGHLVVANRERNRGSKVSVYKEKTELLKLEFKTEKTIQNTVNNTTR